MTDLVVIDYTFSDETAGQSEPMSRWAAEWELWRMVTFDLQPVPGKRVTRALLIPREERVH